MGPPTKKDTSLGKPWTCSMGAGVLNVFPTRPQTKPKEVFLINHETSAEGLLQAKEVPREEAVETTGASDSKEGPWAKRTPQTAKYVCDGGACTGPGLPKGQSWNCCPSSRIMDTSRCTLWWWLQGMHLLAQCLELTRSLVPTRSRRAYGKWTGQVLGRAELREAE